MTYISQELGDRNAIRVVSDAAGRVTLYEHTDGDHAFRIVFDPALALDAAPGPPSRYEMSLDGFGRLVTGVAQVRAGLPNGVTIGWRATSALNGRPHIGSLRFFAPLPVRSTSWSWWSLRRATEGARGLWRLRRPAIARRG